MTGFVLQSSPPGSSVSPSSRLDEHQDRGSSSWPICANNNKAQIINKLKVKTKIRDDRFDTIFKLYLTVQFDLVKSWTILNKSIVSEFPVYLH